MSYWILPESGIPISATTVQRITYDERSSEETKKRMNEYDERLKRVFDAQSAPIIGLHDIPTSKVIDPYNEDPAFFEEFTRVIDDATLKHADDEADAIDILPDNYVGMEMAITRGGEGAMVHANVRRRVCDKEGRPIGNPHSNPLLDSRLYEVEYADGHIEELTANVIAENLISQVDEEGRRQMMLDSIIDHRVLHDAVPRSEGTYTNSYGVKRHKATTRGWEMLVEWRDGSSDWIAMKDLKESYPVELAMYATDRKIDDEPAFAWWLPYVLKKTETDTTKSKVKILVTYT